MNCVKTALYFYVSIVACLVTITPTTDGQCPASFAVPVSNGARYYLSSVSMVDPSDGGLIHPSDACPTDCPGDVTGDGILDGRDVVQFTALQFSPNPTPAELCAGDFNLDNEIDPDDSPGFSQAILLGLCRSSVSIIQNGIVVPQPAYPYLMDGHNGGDLPALRDYAEEHEIFAGINMSADWKDREWEMIQAIVAWVSGNLNLQGFNTEIPTPEPRAILILNAMANDGAIVGWGDDDPYGNVDGLATALDPNIGFVAVKAGWHHSLALRETGVIVAWGRNQFGQGTAPSPNSGFTSIAAGANHNLALKTDGSVIAWGDNSAGQCNVPSPNSNFNTIAAGTAFSIGLKSDGSVVTWGSLSTSVPFNPTWQTYITNITAGGNHCLAIIAGNPTIPNGTVVAWGDNSAGQCNVPTTYAAGTQPLTGNVLAIAADALRSYAAVDRGSNIISWGLPLTITFPSQTFRMWTNPSCRYVIGRTTVNPSPTIALNGTADEPLGTIPSPPAGTSWTDMGPGKGFALGVTRHLWICGSMAQAVHGLCVAHGIPARRIGGADTDCCGDVLLEVFSTRFNKWILIFSTGGRWIENAAGIPQSLREMRAHHDAGDYVIQHAYEVGFVGRGFRAVAANGSGLTFQPSAMGLGRLFPYIPVSWWSDMLLTPNPRHTDLMTHRHAFARNRFHNSSPDPHTSHAFLFDDHTDVDEPYCPGHHYMANNVLTTDSDPNVTYPLNNVHAEAELVEPTRIRITLTHNMVAETGGFDHYEMSLDDGHNWTMLNLENEADGVYIWYPPFHSAMLMIRGVNVAGLHSPDIAINFTYVAAHA